MKNRNLVHSDNWETPKWLYDQLDKEFQFDFDPCPICTTEILPEKDGLLIQWGDMNFVNPPYSRKLKEAFVEKAIEQKRLGRSSVLLLPVSTSTVLFHDRIKPNAKEIRFIRGRVRFKGINTKGEQANSSPMHDSMIVYFECDPIF